MSITLSAVTYTVSTQLLAVGFYFTVALICCCLHEVCLVRQVCASVSFQGPEGMSPEKL